MKHTTHKLVSRTIIRLFPIVLVALVAALLTQGEIRRKPLKAPQSLWGQQGNWEESFYHEPAIFIINDTKGAQRWVYGLEEPARVLKLADELRATASH